MPCSSLHSSVCSVVVSDSERCCDSCDDDSNESAAAAGAGDRGDAGDADGAGGGGSFESDPGADSEPFSGGFLLER